MVMCWMGGGAIQVCAAGHDLADDRLAHMAPLSWEHINLTGDYAWREVAIAQAGQRPLGPIPFVAVARAA
jgi:hypothetical protein